MDTMSMKVEQTNIDELIPYASNSRTHSEEQVAQIAASIKEFGFNNPVLLDGDNGIIAGHGRTLAARKLGLKEVPTIELAHLSDSQRKAYIIADNKLALNAGWDMKLLSLEMGDLKDDGFDLSLLGFDNNELEEMFKNEDEASRAGNMKAAFGAPPFSVLNAREGDWQTRKKNWMALIGDNGESRKGTLGDENGLLGGINNGVSILDPAMAELIVKWFGVQGGLAFDPFAGDSVFGYVAGSCGMKFQGIELRKEQADLNIKRTVNLDCEYFCDTSENLKKYILDSSVDLLFTCPPYADLEVYSNDPKDLSTMPYGEFVKTYTKIIKSSCEQLKKNRFAVCVVGEVRAKDGSYYNFVSDTIKAFTDAGLSYYNEIILVTPVGTLPMRAGKAMRATRKIGKTHQNILVFVKGDPKKAVADMGDISSSIVIENEN